MEHAYRTGWGILDELKAKDVKNPCGYTQGVIAAYVMAVYDTLRFTIHSRGMSQETIKRVTRLFPEHLKRGCDSCSKDYETLKAVMLPEEALAEEVQTNGDEIQEKYLM